MTAIGRPKPGDLVTKGNALVHACYVMSWQEKMLMWFTIWAYQQHGSKHLTIKCKEFGDYAGIDRGGLYSEVWTTARRLRERELLLWKEEEERIGALGFLSYVEYGKDRSGEVDVVITDEIVPHIDKFIEDLKIGFTRYEMAVISSLKSFHGLRLYEIAKSIDYGKYRKDGWECSVDELRKRFGSLVIDRKGKVLNDEYREWKYFRRKVLDKAALEVNMLTDLKVTYDLRKRGREVVAVILYVRRNTVGASVMNAEGRFKHLAQAMARLGVSAKRIDALLAEFGIADPERLIYAIRATEEAVKGGKVKSAAAWFVAAVKRDDRKQGQLFTAEERAREKQKETEELTREARLRRRPAGPDRGVQSVADVLATSNPRLAEALGKMAAKVGTDKK